VMSRPTLLDATGTEREAGGNIFALGVSSLCERIPKSFQIEHHAAWQWHRYAADRRGGRGSRMDVEGLVLK
jgi:hypothetical protein